MIIIAPNGHFLMHMPQPIHNSSDMKAILLSGIIALKYLPILTTGHDFLHSCLHFLGLHLSELTIAILVNLSLILV
ncbi:hypothetical protein C2G38_1969161 [Gigaspora rosea]|uniref:Uncharacterized protein n=1 Tax=Gigaspora rosea TaxID=44941 RepID=A0A397V433_9GLOM|nr:hypothetical protein C2G38_1969161 [Gigaspora rosea]